MQRLRNAVNDDIGLEPAQIVDGLRHTGRLRARTKTYATLEDSSADIVDLAGARVALLTR